VLPEDALIYSGNEGVRLDKCGSAFADGDSFISSFDGIKKALPVELAITL
jgi:hypothetical protein